MREKRNKNFIIHVLAVKMIADYLGVSFLNAVRFIQNKSGRLVKLEDTVYKKKRRRRKAC